MKTIEEFTNNTLRQKRKSFKLRQQDVANALGFDAVDRISYWERGMSAPSITNLLKLCALYNSTVQELYPYLYEDIYQDLTKRIKNLTTFSRRNTALMG